MPSIEQKFTTFCSNGQPPARFQVDNYFSLAGEPLSLEGMVKTSIDTDLVRLRQFLNRLEADAQIAVGDVDLGGREIESLKREIAYIEGILNGDPRCGSRAFLFQIPIDFGSSRRAL